MASSLANAGLTPQQSIVNPDGTPTMFFFRWLLSMRGAAITTADLEIFETFADGSLDAALANILAAAGETFLQAELAGEGAAAGELGARVRELEAGGSFSGGPRLVDDGDGDRYALEAFMAQAAPVDPPVVIAVTNFVPVIQIGGSAAGIAFTTVAATSTIVGSGTGAPVTVFISVNITAWPASPVGNVTIGGFPVVPIKASPCGVFLPKSGFTGLTVPIIPQVNNTPAFLLDVQTATGITPLAPTVFTAASVFTITATYPSA